MFELATPWALILLPLPYLIWRYLPPATHTQHEALRVPFFAHLKKIYQASTQTKHQPWWLWLTWIFLILALSGPRYVGDKTPSSREEHNIMLALDISGSMAVDDMIVRNRRYTRLAVVEYAAESFVKQRPNDKIGLILFGTKSYLLTPLTYDKKHILSRLDDASVGLAGQATAIGDAIGLSIKHLRKTPPEGRVLILLTDGVNNAGTLSPLKAAELAHHEHIKIYTIGLGSDSSQFGPFALMSPQIDLDEDTLKKIASITQGRYFRATNLSSLQRIYTLINQIETVTEQTEIRPQRDYYPWPLAIAFIIFFTGLLHKMQMFSYMRRWNL